MSVHNHEIGAAQSADPVSAAPMDMPHPDQGQHQMQSWEATEVPASGSWQWVPDPQWSAVDAEQGDADVEQLAATHKAGVRDRLRSPLLIRRTIGVGLILAFAFGVFHVIFQTDLLALLLDQAEPATDAIAWVKEDPKRAWGALAAVIIPHLGLYFAIFDDRNR